ncbi:MAG TPA: radical SAM protein [Candidatus Binataceae bacterium]|nr:radical SAM protein [Candidatus Binataceae bacterium]
MAKVTLVRPPALVPKGSLQGPITPPLGVAYLAASLRAAGHVPVVIDATGEAPFNQVLCFDDRLIAAGLPVDEIVARIPEDTDIVGISCMFSQDWPYAKRIVEAIRSRLPRVLIIAGGEHITALASYILESCPEIDLCALGEGEETIVEIAACVDKGGDLGNLHGLALRRSGKPVQTPARARVRNIDAIPPPAWDLVPMNNYLDNGMGYGIDLGRSMPMLATRGCPYQCTFCSNPVMWTTRWVARDPGLVLDEFQDYAARYQATNIDFYDLTAILKKDWIVKFCSMIEQRGMKFTWQTPSGTRSEALDAEVCRALYRSGCRYISYAPESGSPSVLKRIKKRVNLDKMMASMRAAVKEGMSVKANMIIGIPDETRREAWESIGFLAKLAILGVQDIGISTFSPYPGSELFDHLRERGKLPKLNEDYFLSLASQTDISMSVSHCENLSNREVSILHVVGYATFYGLQYAIRPWRLVRTLYNVASNKQKSRLDKLLQELLQRRAAVKRRALSEPQTSSTVARAPTLNGTPPRNAEPSALDRAGALP